MNFSPVQTQYVKFKGGLDLLTSVLAIQAGACLDAVNYVPGINSGYERIDGFERFDGRPSPSDAIYYTALCTFSGTPAVGNTVTGSTSGATGVIAAINGTTLTLTKVVGTFVAEAFTGGGGGTFTASPAIRGELTSLGDAQALNAAADIYRADIAAVPGAGPVLGVWMYNGVLYAFRNNVGQTAAVMYRSSASGWQAITLNEEISFTAGNDTIVDGATLTQGGVTATILRVVQTTTATSPSRVGRLIISGRTGGNFASGAANGGALTLSGVQTQITLAPSGRYEFVNYNFSGAANRFRMYGASGTHFAFEFDGTVFVPIRTGMTTVADTPTYITAHQNMLFLSYGASLQNSGVGTPYVWTVISGAAENALGENITGLLPQASGVLVPFTRNSTRQLSGTSTLDFRLNFIAPEQGAISRTAQNIGVAVALDDRGVIQIDRIQEFGNFQSSTLSERVQPIIDALRTKVIGSAVYRSRNQYRLYANDGTGVVVKLNRKKGEVEFTKFDYNSGRTSNLVNPTCMCAVEDATGKDVVFFGADNGFVYQADKGSSFDGEDIEAWLRMPFNNSQSPRMNKRYRMAVMEMTSRGYSLIRVQPEFSFGDDRIASHETVSKEIVGGGGYYDADLYDTFFYDARLAQTPSFKIKGTGINMALLFYSKSDYDLGHLLTGITIHFSPRALERQ